MIARISSPNTLGLDWRESGGPKRIEAEFLIPGLIFFKKNWIPTASVVPWNLALSVKEDDLCNSTKYRASYLSQISPLQQKLHFLIKIRNCLQMYKCPLLIIQAFYSQIYALCNQTYQMMGCFQEFQSLQRTLVFAGFSKLSTLIFKFLPNLPAQSFFLHKCLTSLRVNDRLLYEMYSPKGYNPLQKEKKRKFASRRYYFSQYIVTFWKQNSIISVKHVSL